MIRSKMQSNYYTNTTHYKGDYTQTKYSVTNCAGYGFKLRIVKGVYFNDNIGAGIALTRDDYKFENMDDPSLSYSKKGNILSDGKPTFIFTLGFGYDF